MEEIKPTETLYSWDDMPEVLQKLVVEVTAIKLKIKDRSNVARVQELGKPKVIFDNDRKYFRIHEDSQKLMVMLTNQYLL